jgi:C-terminal processing protease CtpA/Prc
VLIETVYPDGPADRAGIRVGDVVLDVMAGPSTMRRLSAIGLSPCRSADLQT